MKVLIITNIPSPYRIDFFNILGNLIDLTVIFEADNVKDIQFNWNYNENNNFNAIFLKKGIIHDRKINWKILKYIKKNIYDFIIVTNYACYTEMLAIMYLKIKKIPFIMEIDGGLLHNESKIKFALKKMLISNASAFISPSMKADQYLMHYGANKNDIYRYQFTSLRKKDLIDRTLIHTDKNDLKSKLRIRESRVVLSVGQFIYRKGYDVLLEACQFIDKNIGVYLIGGKPTEEYLELCKKYDLVNIHFVDFKSKDELAKYFLAADLFVLPTREDVWGLVINEAMNYGLPVVTTNKCVAGLELIVDDVNGYIVPPDDARLLSEKINKIINNQELQEKMSGNNLQKISNYTIENMVNVHINIFNKLSKNSITE